MTSVVALKNIWRKTSALFGVTFESYMTYLLRFKNLMGETPRYSAIPSKCLILDNLKSHYLASRLVSGHKE
jgi:hypothetical protein